MGEFALPGRHYSALCLQERYQLGLTQRAFFTAKTRRREDADVEELEVSATRGGPVSQGVHVKSALHSRIRGKRLKSLCCRRAGSTPLKRVANERLRQPTQSCVDLLQRINHNSDPSSASSRPCAFALKILSSNQQSFDEPVGSGGDDEEGTGWSESARGDGMLSHFPDQGQHDGRDEDLAQFDAEVE
jgi:hypothetical protein